MLRYNYSNASGLAARQFGTNYGMSRYLYSRSDLHNFALGDGFNNLTAGIPNGHLFPSSWILPIQPGGISSYRDMVINFSTGLIRGTFTDIVGNTTITCSSTGTANGLGVLVGAVSPFTELSPRNLADAVWNAEANQYTTDGTMGKNANDVKTNSGLIPALV